MGQSAFLQCDFETPCLDFTTDDNWGLTDGYHPRPITYDHTLNRSSGHYLFYYPQSSQQFLLAQIQTTKWTQIDINRTICFKMWYYTPLLNMHFTIQFVQGDDEQLTRVVLSIPGKDPSINDWTQINVPLPVEKMKIFIRLNDSDGILAFDDLSIDYCDGSQPSPPNTIFTCDFESSCTENFISLPGYPYQWSTIQANNAKQKESQAPGIDYTFGNGSGHYIWLSNKELIKQGNVGYLATKRVFKITVDKSYCLNFQYYGYGSSSKSNLKVYLWLQDAPHTVQVLWPLRGSTEYMTWGIINLPIGYYSLLFRVDNLDMNPRSFALDNISITSCDYPPSQLTSYDSLLSIACDFDDLTMCNMVNGDGSSEPFLDFIVITGDKIPNRNLGPTYDHTTNSSAGGFLYWNRELPYLPWSNGRIHPFKPIEQNLGMCIRFAYYVKSLSINKNGTMLALSTGGCYGTTIWSQSMDNSQGWKVAIIPVKEYACMEAFYFDVTQSEAIEVSIAFDDIQIDQCGIIDPTTTTSTTTTTTVTTTTTTSSTTTQSTSTQHMTTATFPHSTTRSSNAEQLISIHGFFLMILYFCILISL
ncbi:unnamed protein product [Adineta steineri]|uniref:MAM domain-containing protein n=1 Tax=Adineta steineri TaxID=433720 RepID=A0A814SZI5_9BILA|nr:unnamed protein product [Adineta steineri]CAF3737898.1 unnamed protein product [Adineta steineri]